MSVAKEEHALYCFDVLQAHLQNSPDPVPKFPDYDEPYAVFVTWNTLRSNREPRLRGCIGNFKPAPLGDQLARYAIHSAMEDTRFSPIRTSELPTLGCGISILTPFEDCQDPLDWSIGTHGIYLKFPHPRTKRMLSATFLPQIAQEQNWSKAQTLQSAVHKAGFKGDLSEIWQEGQTTALEVQRYRSEKVEVSWAQWQESRA